jgi:tRNA(adenine34) deaminase
MAARTNAKSAPRKRKWARTIKTDSTHPPEGTFTKSGEEIARIMARKSVSPGGVGSAIKMVQMFINRGGKKLSAARKRELQKAKRILQDRKDA